MIVRRPLHEPYEQPNSPTRGRPPHPPRPLLPRPKPRWRRGAKRLDGADVKRAVAAGSLREIHYVRFQARRADTSSAGVEGPGCRCKVKSERPGGPTHRIYYATHGHSLERGCVSLPGLMNTNLCRSIRLYCMSGQVWPLQPNSPTRGRPPHPPRPLLPQPKPWGRRGAKRS